jgi:hypothetical protein
MYEPTERLWGALGIFLTGLEDMGALYTKTRIWLEIKKAPHV